MFTLSDLLYIGESGRRLRDHRFDICRKVLSKPVSDISVCTLLNPNDFFLMSIDLFSTMKSRVPAGATALALGHIVTIENYFMLSVLFLMIF